MTTNLEELIDALGNEDDQVEQLAQHRLVEIGAPAIEALISALKDGNAKQRKNAAVLLGSMGDMRAVEPLIAALDDDDFWVWNFAAHSLGRLGDVRAVEPLLAALKNGQGFGVAEALGSLGDERAIDLLIAGLENDELFPRALIHGLSQFKNERVIAPLMMALHFDEGYDDKIQRYATNGLINIGTLAVEPLIASLQDDDLFLVECVIEILQEIKDSRAVAPLIGLLQTAPNDALWNATAFALAAIGDNRAVNALAVRLNDENEYVRFAAANALMVVGDERGVEPLIALLSDKGNRTRNLATQALGQTKDKRAVKALIKCLKEDDIQASAVIALKKIGDTDATEPLLAVLARSKGVPPVTVIDALGELGDARAIVPLLALQTDAAPWLQDRVKQALGKLGYNSGASPN